MSEPCTGERGGSAARFQTGKKDLIEAGEGHFGDVLEMRAVGRDLGHLFMAGGEVGLGSPAGLFLVHRALYLWV